MTWGEGVVLSAAVFSAMGVWSGVILTRVNVLHERRRQQQEKRDQAISDRIEALSQKANQDHAALAVQVADITSTIRDHYVRRTEHEALRDVIAETRAEIKVGFSHVAERLDRLFQDVEWRGKR